MVQCSDARIAEGSPHTPSTLPSLPATAPVAPTATAAVTAVPRDPIPSSVAELNVVCKAVSTAVWCAPNPRDLQVSRVRVRTRICNVCRVVLVFPPVGIRSGAPPVAARVALARPHATEEQLSQVESNPTLAPLRKTLPAGR